MREAESVDIITVGVMLDEVAIELLWAFEEGGEEIELE